MTTNPVEQLVARVRADLREAQRRRDRATMAPLREILSVIDNASAVDAPQGFDYSGTAPTEVARREVTLVEVHARLHARITERRDAAATYRGLDRGDHADQLDQEAELIATYVIDG